MTIRSKYNTYQLLKNQANTLIPIFAAGIILIWLIVVDIQNLDAGSHDNPNMNIYIELALSLVTSILVILLLSYVLRPPFNIYIIGWSLGMIIINPVVLVITRNFLQNKTHIKTINLFIIGSVLLHMWFTFIAATG